MDVTEEESSQETEKENKVAPPPLLQKLPLLKEVCLILIISSPVLFVHSTALGMGHNFHGVHI